LINGNGRSAKLIMKDLLPTAVQWTHEQGQICIGFKNCGYHGGLGTIARKFAEANVVCIYTANGGPATVPPYGGSKELLGTNPIAYAIPTSGMPIVFDAATSERPFGTIARAKKQHESLIPNTYYARSGEFTTVPNEAVAIKSFGGHKGSAINLLLDVITGALVGAKSGSLVGSDPDIGGYMQLLDPAAFGELSIFTQQSDQLVKDIQSNPPAPGLTEVRIPGYRAQQLREQQLAAGTIAVSDDVWEAFIALHAQLS
jgi:LDH2 family malate/lactate/ureidoglycolate dehydrogenase